MKNLTLNLPALPAFVLSQGTKPIRKKSKYRIEGFRTAAGDKSIRYGLMPGALQSPSFAVLRSTISWF